MCNKKKLAALGEGKCLVTIERLLSCDELVVLNAGKPIKLAFYISSIVAL